MARLVTLLYSDLPLTILPCSAASTSYFRHLNYSLKNLPQPLNFPGTHATLEAVFSVLPTIIDWASKPPCGCNLRPSTSITCTQNIQSLREKASSFLKLELVDGLCLYCFDNQERCYDHQK